MKNSLLVIALVASLASCERDTRPMPQVQSYQQSQPQVGYQQPAPVIINQAPVHDNSVNSAIAGAAVGYMLGSAGNNRYYYDGHQYSDHRPVQNTTVNKTVIVKQYVNNNKTVPSNKVVTPTKTTSSYASMFKPRTSSSSYRSTSTSKRSFGGFSRRK